MMKVVYFQDIPTTIDGFSTVSLLLVEMVSTDVMYNGLPWPDEDFTKVTMERDLQIRRTFTNAPILWGILGLVATYRPAICFTSVLLRALCASVLNQWRAKTVDKYQVIANNVELYDVTKKLLEVMSMGQLLPPPLSYLHTVIEYLDAPEISVVLKECIWNYMKENVPSPVLYGVDSTGKLREPFCTGQRISIYRKFSIFRTSLARFCRSQTVSHLCRPVAKYNATEITSTRYLLPSNVCVVGA